MPPRTNRWTRNEGLGRLLAQETAISDLLQELSLRDPSPWTELVGFVPERVEREAAQANSADLLLTGDGRSAVIEVKLGHLMSADQQARYEELGDAVTLHLAALTPDKGRLAGNSRWSFLALADVFDAWRLSTDNLARLLADEAARVLGSWDRLVRGVFEPDTSERWLSVDVLDQKFLGQVVARRMAVELRKLGRESYAGVTSGGGLPIVQGWTPVRGEGSDRSFIAEIRWKENKPHGELRFGVDFYPKDGRDEDRALRRAAYSLARSMDEQIRFDALLLFLTDEQPRLARALRRDKGSRPAPRGDWDAVVEHGFAGAPLSGGRSNTRRITRPDFHGDGTCRYQAVADVDFSIASAQRLVLLIDRTLHYLGSRQP